MRLLKGTFRTIKGLEDPSFFCIGSSYIEETTKNFVRILYCENEHWIAVSGGLDDENISIYDSMKRKSIENHLAKQLEKMMLQPAIDQSHIIARVRNTQVQKKTLCGYFACAFATALCFSIDIERIKFDTEKLVPHWLKCINEMKISMFPYQERIYVDKHPKILKFNKITRITIGE